MRIQWLLLSIVLTLLVGLGVPRPAMALSCIPLPDVVAKMDVIVRGRILNVPETGVLELAVSHYYKGDTGPAQLRAEVSGLGQGQRMDWNRVPKVGDGLVIGFVKRGDALVNEACNLFATKAGRKSAKLI